MSILYDKQKLVLIYIVTNCEIYCLNEKEAMQYIKLNFGQISRRTYYNYKNEIYHRYEKNPLFALIRKDPNFRTKMTRFLISDRNELFAKALKYNIKIWEFNKLNFIPQYITDLHARGQKAIDKGKKWMTKSELERRPANTDHISVPVNYTTRLEYIKCGKYSCLSCPHGPYYYAYWKNENGKLRKRYLGKNVKIIAQLGRQDTIMLESSRGYQISR
jgi:hypothetical protein